MTDDEHHKPAKQDSEFRRQMRSGQMARFVDALPLYSVQHEIPDRFARLLRQLDSLTDDDRPEPGRAYRRRH
ncbi:hypothetical protein RB623_11365 [Mesorhizobium sp. LHD-90]|uniref:hypothetical protein n=1 Tax=Mesorhizobium sp. LHD-90 TaxID=3071414 RepID=UPI0027E0BF0D|nr:hypothetical protein [Mesorhizobium sp. LHD-90]MDQ6434644.1 hypothetical protein [Mesorhizobium sp. LHD-90]